VLAGVIAGLALSEAQTSQAVQEENEQGEQPAE
jgi:hypothetical protein